MMFARVLTALQSEAVGLPADQVRQMCDDSNRWTQVADELRALLKPAPQQNPPTE